MRTTTRALLCLIGLTAAAGAQNPLRHFTEGVESRFARSQPVVRYRLSASSSDTSGFAIRMDVRGAPDTFRIALAKHPEYDDQYFRYVADLRVDGGAVAREDSAVWRVTLPGGTGAITYRINLPSAPTGQRAAWRPFLSPTGALAGGPHTFFYVVGAELAPSYVTVDFPASWSVSTGLTPTADPRTFYAASVYDLVESPILAGSLRRWTFAIDGTPHTIAYWPLPNATPFDTTIFTEGLRRMTEQVVRLFGRPAYREFLFAFQDNAYGGLEHPNSVTLGAPSADLGRDANSSLEETAHEFFHTWNLMRIRPAEYVDVTYKPIASVPTLWFSEGLTMFYADLLLRRAGLPTRDSTRIAHLERQITRYTAQPGNSRFSAERVSRVAYNAPPDALGDYDASTHLQGELLGTMLDLMIRDATNGRRSADDLMRLMLDRFSGVRGFTSADVERAAADVCGCAMKPFFDAHVRGAQPIPFDRYLGLIGMRTVVTRATVMQNGQPATDFRIRAWNPPGADSSISLIVMDPASIWGRAGLHSGDRVVSINDEVPNNWPQFRQLISRARIGDTLRFVVRAPGAPPRNAAVVVASWERPVVHLESLATTTDRQRRLQAAWLRAAP